MKSTKTTSSTAKKAATTEKTTVATKRSTEETAPTANFEEIPELGTVLWACTNRRAAEQLVLCGVEKRLCGEMQEISRSVILRNPHTGDKYTKLVTEKGLYDQSDPFNERGDYLVVFKSEEDLKKWKGQHEVDILKQCLKAHVGERAFIVGRMSELSGEIKDLEEYLKEVDKNIAGVTAEIQAIKR